MAKSKVRSAKPARPRARAGRIVARGRRLARDDDAATSPKKAGRSLAARLAAEVEKLQGELIAARAKVAELEARADIDPLLEIINRRGFERELRRSLAYVRRYGSMAALIYLDLDGFKSVNDCYGHAVGDFVLKAVTTTLQQAVRESDVVARLGGDEFGALLWNVSEAQAAAKAAGLEAAIAEARIVHNGVPVSVGVSAGVSMLLPLDAPAEVIARADLAMYARKRTRRKRMS